MLKYFIQDTPLKQHNTLGIGGAAKFFFQAKSVEQMQSAIIYAIKNHIPFHILGKGSNTLFDDQGFNGLVIKNKISFFERRDSEFHVGAGFNFSLLGSKTARLGYGGLEFASGIPASVGGAIYMNAGANGQETQDFLTEVTFVNEQGKLIHLQKNELSFSYRHSPFQAIKGAIVAAKFNLTKNIYAKETVKKILKTRLSSQPYNARTLGCIFKNPEALSAGSLLDQCGLKNKRVGDAIISDLHANFFINHLNATSSDYKQLILLAKSTVKEKWNINLKSEIELIPYE